ncbi:AflN/verA/monooxygenase [Colletotrichum orchidophilum]|uniref:AflN/verA/monooxygenase n=1 Tax=Colletotrichum orchidophilum TaxID=1209926 RepID=A0A1G4BEI0_9PEZI|nr:AflN/verA/monooxygenase [Colletotrichum orchidophilum]OHE99736.1 AflN/verA/monooxygenase [Colletotrichum orchidophilum]
MSTLSMVGGLWSMTISSCFAALLYFLAKFYAARQTIWRMQGAELPIPDYSFLGGHFPLIKRIMGTLPLDSIVHNIMWKISEDYPSGIFYLSLWPFSGTVMVLADADAASQLDSLALGKGIDIIDPIERITGGRSLLTMKGDEWKHWRRLFNPGFSAGYMMGLAPAIADEVAIFRKKLLAKCAVEKSELLLLEDLTLRLTFDIIGSVVLDSRFHHQLQDHPLAGALRKQIEWTSFREPLNPLERYLTIRPLVLWHNGKELDQYISIEIDKRLAERSENFTNPIDTQRSKSIASLFIDEYIKDLGDKDLSERDSVDRKQTIKKIIIPQVRLFLFAGHDTTSSTLLYCYNLLSQNPEIVARVISEHDEVFGNDPSQAQSRIHEDPQLLNKIPYTSAFIKEVLRIFPPAGAMRQGRSDVQITDGDGRVHPTKGCNIWTLSLAIHHNPRYWKDPGACIPERWLVGPEDPLYPPKGAWRPFEWGPRNCIGQTLAMIELKVALAMTVREFVIMPAYEDWDKLHPKSGIRSVNGNRAYQAVKGGGGAHPADGFPVKVNLRNY